MLGGSLHESKFIRARRKLVDIFPQESEGLHIIGGGKIRVEGREKNMDSGIQEAQIVKRSTRGYITIFSTKKSFMKAMGA